MYEKNGEISRNLRFSLVCYPISKLGSNDGWDGWARTIEMPESKSGALPLGYIPLTLVFYHIESRLSITKSKNNNVRYIKNRFFSALDINASLTMKKTDDILKSYKP